VLLHVEKAQELEPDVVLMDITKPAIDRSELTRQLRKILPAIWVVIFSLHESQQIFRKSGVQGPTPMY
jgi:DNA-binding NarL/FixJ family response regulator